MTEKLIKIAQSIQDAGGNAFLVGGAVRDKMLGIEPKDLDVEVFGISAEVLQEVLSQFGEVNTVGKSFGIFKLGEFDFSLPRRDSKVSEGHKGFSVKTDPGMTIEEAAARRDFTINAMSINILTGELVDPFNGKMDLERRTLRATSIKFIEDPLRVLRGMQFASRFRMWPDWRTCWLCGDIASSFKELPSERVWGEWEKLLLKGVEPSIGMDFLLEVGWLIHFPELASLRGLEQDPQWHPEGDVWEHTLHVMDAAARICTRDNITGTDRVIVMLGALCHDLGKFETTQIKDGRIVAPGHAEAGEEPTRSFLARIGCPVSLRDQIVTLVKEHMVHVSIQEPSPKMVRRLINRLDVPLKLLGAVIEADHSGRPPLSAHMPEVMQQILDIGQTMGDTIEPIIKGRHLIPLGIKPGKEMGNILGKLFQLQLDGAFSTVEEGLQFVDSQGEP